MLLLADKSWESDESMVDMDASSMDSLAHKLTSSNKVKEVVEEAAGTDHEEIRSSGSICKHCGKEFKSGKALGGHVRIHSQQQYHYQVAAAASASASAAGLSNKRSRKKHQEDQDNCIFACFVCGESFESIRLLCQHSRNHRDREDDHHHNKDNDSNTTKDDDDDDDDEQPTLESEESSFLGKPLAEEEIHTNGDVEYYDDQNQNQKHGSGSEDLMKRLPKWGRKRSRVISGAASAYQDQDVDDSKVHDAAPLRFYYGPQVVASERRLPTTTTNTMEKEKKKKKLKIQDASMESKSQPSDHSHQSTDNDKVHHAIPLRFYYGPEVAVSERRLPTTTTNTMEKKKKKVKTDGEFNSPNGDASMESKSKSQVPSDDSESTVQLFGCLIKKSNNDTPNSLNNMPSAQGQGIEASSSHGDGGRRRRRRRWKKDEERVHQCDICGKIFDTGHALGGHMTYHRMRDGGRVGAGAAGSFRLVQRKPKPQAVSGELDHHSFVQFRIEEHVEPKPKTVVLDFDLNIPYQE